MKRYILIAILLLIALFFGSCFVVACLQIESDDSNYAVFASASLMLFYHGWYCFVDSIRDLRHPKDQLERYDDIEEK